MNVFTLLGPRRESVGDADQRWRVLRQGLVPWCAAVHAAAGENTVAMATRPEMMHHGADVDLEFRNTRVIQRPHFPWRSMGGAYCAGVSLAERSLCGAPIRMPSRSRRGRHHGRTPHGNVTRAAGKRDGRGSETWKDGRADAFDATGKDAVLIGKGLRKTHDGERYQFRDIDFALSEGQRVAIVGPNGSGKSTLLSVLAGKDVGREDGELWVRKDLNLAFLEQEPPFDPDLGVLEAVYTRDTPLMRLLRRYEKVMADASAGNIDESKMATVLEQMDLLEAWDTETKAHAALDKLGCTEFLSRKMGELSGGQRKRVALAAALIEEPDMLVLDEPTNHLSVEGVEWLENRLQQMTNTATLLVSHDRAFIDAVCSDILELDGTGGTHRHRGGYAAYLEGRETRWAAEAQRVAAAKNTLRKEQEWMRRQPKARATKEKARVERFYSLKTKASNKGSRAKTIDLVESKVTRMGDVIVEFDDASLAFGNGDDEDEKKKKKILDGFSYAFSKGEKIGLVGPNGAGKTTFLKTIMGEVELDSGWVSVGETITFGYYSQIANFRDENLTVVEFVREIESEASCSVGGFGGNGGMTAYKLLERFNFGGSKQMTQIKNLSGGEQRRLQLLSVLALCPNFLILDEPTNDLDLDTIEALEDMLVDFDGCVLVVSHDRAFVDNLVDHIFVFDGKGGIDDWNGDYSALRRYLKKMDDERILEKERTGSVNASGESDVLLTEEEIAQHKQKQQHERDVLKEAHNAPSVIDKIERALAVLETEVEKIDEKMLKCGSDVAAAQEVQVEKDAKTAKQELYMAEWERLEMVVMEAEEIRAEQEAKEGSAAR